MKVIKKICILLFSLCFIYFFIPSFLVADSDINDTKLDINSINVSNKYVTVGDKIKISFKVDNISGDIDYVDAYYSKPIVNTLADKIMFKYNAQNGLFESELEITDTWINGEYLFNRLMISIGKYNEIYYNSENEYNINEHGKVVNLNSFNFTVHDTNGDNTPPSIIPSSLEVSTDRTVIGDTITYKVKVLENTELKNVKIELATETGRYKYDYKTLSMKYNPSSKLYEANLIIDDTLLAGYWSVYSINAKDKFSNSFTLYNTQIYSNVATLTEGYANLAKATFRNYKNYPDAKIYKNEILVENKNVTAGDNLKISLLIQDDFNVDNVKIYYKQNLGNKKIILSPELERITETRIL